MKFDFNINKITRKILTVATKKIPNRTWFVSVTFWEDLDFNIEVCSSWGTHQDIFYYRKSFNDNKIRYWKKEINDKYGEEVEIL